MILFFIFRINLILVHGWRMAKIIDLEFYRKFRLILPFRQVVPKEKSRLLLKRRLSLLHQKRWKVSRAHKRISLCHSKDKDSFV